MEIKSLAENLIFVTVRIDTVDANGNEGSGTGFLFSHEYKENNLLAIVTNKHVVADTVKGGVTFIKKDGENPKLGDSFRIDFNNFENTWIGHPEKNIDVAITWLTPILNLMKDKNNIDVFFRTISSTDIPSEDDVKEIDALEEVIFIGYPNGIWDSKNQMPIIRRGTTATQYAIDYEGTKKFIIDASIFGGSSGSPLFLYSAGMYSRKSGVTVVGSRFFFLGIVSTVFFKKSANEIISLPIPSISKDIAIGKEMIDLGIVYKSCTIVETIENAFDNQWAANGLGTRQEKISKKGYAWGRTTVTH